MLVKTVVILLIKTPNILILNYYNCKTTFNNVTGLGQGVFYLLLSEYSTKKRLQSNLLKGVKNINI